TTDRLHIDWPTAQLDLLHKLVDLGKPLVVIASGDIVDNSPVLSLSGVDSLIWANWPGQDGGPAVMKVITGVVAAAGRLPITQYPRNYTENSMLDMHLRPTDKIPGRTYRWFDGAVQPFGFGMHYTTFNATFSCPDVAYSISGLLKDCNAEYPDTCVVPSLDVSITNTGNRTSDFVALAFIKGE
ncbi:hypothetical protein HBI65_251230, partial [Parastagonospora nodorum]